MPEIGAENWLSGNISLKLNNHWKFNLENQLRIDFDNGSIERNFTEFQIEEKISKSLYWGISYRYILRNINFEEGLAKYNRYNFYWILKHNLGNNNRFKIEYKIQSQRRRETFKNTNKYVGELRKYWRIKTVLSYNIKNWKLDPKVGIEFFLRSIHHPSDQYNRYRISIGTKKKINKNQYITFKYMFEKQYKQWNPEIMHVFGIKYNYSKKHYTKNYLNKNNDD
ncbi:MAG: hypothetical protein CL846_09220 [Crocinitomicaceae bacterium]|nr:hypothetical protein [Crocinitomicaceae bacterium]|tara:strand:+ start:1792 stop:2463 length:672 start_codon:yes stop_codon:yes gene_type:complete